MTRTMRVFVGIDLGAEHVPDETTICRFRHLMERHNLGDQLIHLVNQYLKKNGMKVNQSTIVDASIIYAPSSTKNKKKQCDPDMHQTRKASRHATLSDEERAQNRPESKVRAKVEHVFGVMKGQFGFTKVRYKGPGKNAHHLFVSCALANLIMAKKTVLRRGQLALHA